MNNAHVQAHPPYPLMRILTFGEFTLERLVYSPITASERPRYARLPWEEWDSRRPAMTLLKVLLCRFNRQASREELIEAIWPGKKTMNAAHALDSAASILRRHILCAVTGESLLHSGRVGGVACFRLSAQPRLWIDADAFLSLATRALQAERLGQDPRPMLEAAYALAAGPFLEDDLYQLWAIGRRQTINGARNRVLYKLVDRYMQEGRRSQAEELLFTFLEEHPTEEDALYRLMLLLAESNRRQEALSIYQYSRDVMHEENREPALRTQQLAQRIQYGRSIIREQRASYAATDLITVPLTHSIASFQSKRRCDMHVEVDTIYYGNYQFAVELDTGSETGANQLTVYVAEKLPINSIPLTQFSLDQLLNALREPQQARLRAQLAAEKQTCQKPFEDEIADLQRPFQPGGEMQGQKLPAKVKQQLREIRAQMKIALQRLESDFLCRELRTLERSAFDFAILAAECLRYGEWSFLRDFYFDEANHTYIHNFCQKFATDEAYRQAVLAHETRWAKRNALFVRNLVAIMDEDTPFRASATRCNDCKTRDLFYWIDTHVEAILALPEYQQLKEIDSAFQPGQEQIDPAIQPAIERLNQIPGVSTRFSCQGISGKIQYQGHDLLVVSPHEEFAYVSFSALGQSAYNTINMLLPQFPAIMHHHIFSGLSLLPALRSTGDNLRFREELLMLAQCVLDSVDENWNTHPYEEKHTHGWMREFTPQDAPASVPGGIQPERLAWLCQPEQIERTLHHLSHLNHWAKARERFLYADRQGLYEVKATILRQAYTVGALAPTVYIDGTPAFASDYSYDIAVDVACESFTERLSDFLTDTISSIPDDGIDNAARKLFHEITGVEATALADIQGLAEERIKTFINTRLHEIVDHARLNRQPVPARELEALFIWPLDLLPIQGGKGRRWLEWIDLDKGEARHLDPEGTSLIAFQYSSATAQYTFHLPFRTAETFLPPRLINSLRRQPGSSRESSTFSGRPITEDESWEHPIEEILRELEVDVSMICPHRLIEKEEYVRQMESQRAYHWHDEDDEWDEWDDDETL